MHNGTLLSAIFSDVKRWDAEGIPAPGIIVVSGDVVQGVTMDDSDPEGELSRQYEEAADFLDRLAQEIVDSDRSRVVIVPGNHDVNWVKAHQAMSAMTNCPQDVQIQSLEPDSNVRWNWYDRKAYTIQDLELYDARFEHFREFRRNFYGGSITIDEHDVVFGEYEEDGVIIVGLASWYGNDCFCRVGDIHPDALETSRLKLQTSNAPVAIAVWHHSISGGPRNIDYMDRSVVEKLIDFGFTIGLHGHQHYPSAEPTEIRLPNKERMAVVSAGSLAVGNRELPTGEPRQFNIIDIDPDSETVTIHVREMSKSEYFSGSYRNDFGGNTYIQLKLKHAASRPKPPTTTHVLDEAIEAISNREFDNAIAIIEDVDDSYSIQKRKITIEALEGKGDHEDLLQYLVPPKNVDELIRIIDILIAAKRFDDAIEQLNDASDIVDLPLYDDLARKIDTERMMWEDE